MKNTFTKLLSLALVVILCLGTLTACPGGGKNDEEIKDIEDIVTDEADDLKGIDFDGKTIWVGNTAATTGAMAGVGEPFNLGLQAAFEAYNKAGGYNGMSIKLKHYDDGGEADKASTLMDKLIQEDEIFVFGCRNSGRHFDGASCFALEHFGAIMGQREGRQGRSYARR